MTAKLELIEGGDPVRRQAAAWFARQRADDVTLEETQAWHRWLAADPDHRAAYARLERLWSGLGAHAAEPQIARRLADAPVCAPTSSPAARWCVRLGVAAVLVAALFGAWWAPPAPSSAQDTLYATAVGAHRDIVLEDGSRITLDTDTRLRVAYLDTERRLVLERGRAFFRIAPERRPMRVATPHGGVRVVGTAFELDQRADALDVTLIEGKVDLLPADADARDLAGVPLRAGHRARLVAGHVAAIERLRGGDAPTWLSGRLVFEDATLAEAIGEFNRYSAEQWVIEDPRLADIRLTGVFRSDAPHAFVGAVGDLHPIAIDTGTPGVRRIEVASARPPRAPR